MTETSGGNACWFQLNNERIQETCLYLYVTMDRYGRKYKETLKLQRGQKLSNVLLLLFDLPDSE